MNTGEVVSALMVMRAGEHLEAPWRDLPPRTYMPAVESELRDLERRAGQALESSYREVLAITDGIENFHMDMSLFGARDWRDGVAISGAVEFGETIRDIGVPVDVGLPINVNMFPVAIDADGTSCIYMIEAKGVAERYWWVGNGDSMFFSTLVDVLSYVIDPTSVEFRPSIT